MSTDLSEVKPVLHDLKALVEQQLLPMLQQVLPMLQQELPEGNLDETFDLPAPVSIQSQPLVPPKESTPQPKPTLFSASLLIAGLCPVR